MAWRPSAYLIEGELDNTTRGVVTGWMRFAGLPDMVTFDLRGNFHRDIRGANIRFHGDGHLDDADARSYMEGFALQQTGEVGDMTAGLPPQDYVKYPYLEWYGADNGRVVVELDAEQVQVVSPPIPACESDPIPRSQQNRKLAAFVASLSAETRAPVIVVGNRPPAPDEVTGDVIPTAPDE